MWPGKGVWVPNRVCESKLDPIVPPPPNLECTCLCVCLPLFIPFCCF